MNKNKLDVIEINLDAWFPKRNISRVLLINPPDAHSELFQFSIAKRGRCANYPPYGLLTLTQHLRAMNIEVQVLNLNHEILKHCYEIENSEDLRFDITWQKLVDNNITNFRPQLIGVTCMFTMTHVSFKNVCIFSNQFSIPIVIGGVHSTNDPERVLSELPFVKAVFLREADITFQDFIKVVNRQEPVQQLSQMVLNLEGGPLTLSGQRIPASTDISVVPAWDSADIKDATKYGIIGTFYYLKPKGTPTATILSNRGCRAQCTFCGVRSFNGKGVRHRTISSVIDELEILQSEFGIKHFMWLDDDLLKDEKRAVLLFNEMVSRNLSLTWDATNGIIAYSCTNEVIHAAAESGCIAVNIGMESGNETMLRRIRKPGTINKFIETANVLHKYEQIYANLLLLIGLPDETMGMVLDTMEVAREMNLDWCRISPLQPLPNTPIYEEMIGLGLIEDTGYKASSEVRFSVGPYGKLAEMEQGLRNSTPDFRKAFSEIAINNVPSRTQLADIWFYMNYSLNFHRLFKEKRPNKIRQQMSALSAIINIISPNNAFALYYLIYLGNLEGKKPKGPLLNRLENTLENSKFWADRFHAFGLSAKDLVNQNLSPTQIPLKPQGYSETRQNF